MVFRKMLQFLIRTPALKETLRFPTLRKMVNGASGFGRNYRLVGDGVRSGYGYGESDITTFPKHPIAIGCFPTKGGIKGSVFVVFDDMMECYVDGPLRGPSSNIDYSFVYLECVDENTD
jgi:hypothetical protein